MTSFHPFPRLPPELRREIWDLSIPPRQVDIRAVFEGEEEDEHWCDTGWPDFPELKCLRSRSTTPPALQACHEARAYLEGVGGYTKAFTGGGDPIYTWVNFALDTIALDNLRFELDWTEVLSDEWDRIVRLRLSHPGIIPELFERGSELRGISHGFDIRELTLADTWSYGSRQDYWFLVTAYELMMDWYYRCDPVSYYTVIPHPDAEDLRVDPDNYLEVFEAVRQRYANSPYRVGRDFRPLPWRHSKTCSCEHEDAPAPRPLPLRPDSVRFYAGMLRDC